MFSGAMRRVTAGLGIAVGLLFGVEAPGQPVAGPRMERNVVMKTRDGVVLRADIYHPAGGGKFPVLLQRTPYNKDGGTEFALKAVARGYLVVIQDVRGRYASD